MFLQQSSHVNCVLMFIHVIIMKQQQKNNIYFCTNLDFETIKELLLKLIIIKGIIKTSHLSRFNLTLVKV